MTGNRHRVRQLLHDRQPETMFRVPLPDDSFNLDLLYMFQICELSCSESPADRLSRVGFILEADCHVADRLPVRIRCPINGLTFIKTDYLLLLF